MKKGLFATQNVTTKLIENYYSTYDEANEFHNSLSEVEADQYRIVYEVDEKFYDPDKFVTNNELVEI